VLYQMMTGLLKQRRIVVQRRRVRTSLQRTDPTATAKRWSQTATRRTYSVPTPNFLWHIDGHMKLIRLVYIINFVSTLSVKLIKKSTGYIYRQIKWRLNSTVKIKYKWQLVITINVLLYDCNSFRDNRYRLIS
jgi:hypothetical protein